MAITYIHALSYSATFDSDTYTITVFAADLGRMAVLHTDAVIPEGEARIPAEALTYREAVHRYHRASHLEITLQSGEKTISLRLAP